MKTIKPMRLALFAPLIMGAVYAQDNPLYWVGQENAHMLSYGVFSPTGNYSDALTGNPDWSLYDIVIDAEYTGNAPAWEGGPIGINCFTGFDGNWSVKSFTVADNWDGSFGSNKVAAWWEAQADAEVQKNYS